MCIAPSIFFHYLQECSIIQLHLTAYNVITACKLATTEHDADAFFQSQLVKIQTATKIKRTLCTNLRHHTILNKSCYILLI